MAKIMVGMRYIISIVCVLLIYWLFFRKQSYRKWYTCLLAVVIIAFTAFLLDFSLTVLSYGNLRGALVSFLLFAAADAALIILWKVSPAIAGKFGKPGQNTAEKEM